MIHNYLTVSQNSHLGRPCASNSFQISEHWSVSPSHVPYMTRSPGSCQENVSSCVSSVRSHLSCQAKPLSVPIGLSTTWGGKGGSHTPEGRTEKPWEELPLSLGCQKTNKQPHRGQLGTGDWRRHAYMSRLHNRRLGQMQRWSLLRQSPFRGQRKGREGWGP